MSKSPRQSMAWLHSWVGLLMGWLLYMVFVFGSISYYRHQISAWMQPAFQKVEFNQDQALKGALDYLQEHAQASKSWFIDIAKAEKPINTLYWQKQDLSYGFATLEPNTGKEIILSTTEGGDFFYKFHFQFYAIPYTLGRLIAAILAFALLVILISGVITHKKIFKDFFTLRLKKSQRSWLDFHNVSAVVALPFYFVMAFTGLMLVFYFLFPQGLNQYYSENRNDFFEQLRMKSTALPLSSSNVKISSLNSSETLQIIQQKWQGEKTLNTVSVDFHQKNQPIITVATTEDQSITQNPESMSFSKSDGMMLPNPKNDSSIATLYYSMYGLHLARFSEPLTRFALFCSGILGALMIASGLLLWSLKREIQNKKNQFHFGQALVYRSNISFFIGIPSAIIVYLYANRLSTIAHPLTANIEIKSFFIAFVVCYVMNLCLKKHNIWQVNLIIFASLALCLPLLNIIQLIRYDYLQSAQDYLAYWSVDLMVFMFGSIAVLLCLNVKSIQLKATGYLQKKVNSKREQP